jgi:DNA-binding beta-propeller fold protein YncE
MAGGTAIFRLTLSDATTGQPVSARPAGWVAAKEPGQADDDAIGRRVAEFASGSPTSRPAIDLNAFQIVTMNGDATLSVLDPLSGFGGSKLLGLVDVPSPADDWALDSGHRRLYVGCGAAARVAEVDTTTWTVARLTNVIGPVRRVAVQPDGHYLWAATEAVGGQAATITPIQTDRMHVGTPVPVGDGPHDLAFDQDSRFVFVCCAAGGTVSVIATGQGTKEAELRLGPRPAGVGYSAAAGAVYVPDAQAGEIAVVDANTLKVRTRIPAPRGLGTIRFAPGGRWGFVPVSAAGQVLILDAAAARVVQTVDVDKAPDQITFTDRFAYVRHRDSAVVVLIPLDRIGNPTDRSTVFEVIGGRSPFGGPGAGASTPAAGIIQAAGEGAALIANPADKTIYYYAEGMAAPKGGFSTYGRTPRAVLAIERNLRVRAPGIYETAARLPPGGVYEVIVRLDSPQWVHAFELTVASPSAHPTPPPVFVELLADGPAVAGEPAPVRFHITRGPDRTPVTGARDLVVQAYCPGTWQVRQSAKETDPGIYATTFRLPRPGLYFFHLDSPTAGLAMTDPRQLVMSVTEMRK